MAAQIRIPRLECKRCGHRWVPRQAIVKMCARCKSLLWDVPQGTPRKRAPARRRPKARRGRPA
jgi:hypothetical protein